MNNQNENTVYVKSLITELFSTTEVTQYYTNDTSDDIELTISFPISKDNQLIKFIVKEDNKTIESKVFPKEKAKEKYTDSLADNNQAIFGGYQENKDGFYSINVGGIKPKGKVELISNFIQQIKSNDLSFQYVLTQNYPNFHPNQPKQPVQPIQPVHPIQPHMPVPMRLPIHNPKIGMPRPETKVAAKKNINAKLQLKVNSNLTRLIMKNTTQNVTQIVNVLPSQKEANISLTVNNQNNSNTQESFPNILLLFRTSDMYTPSIYKQYNPILNETTFALSYMYSDDSNKIPNPQEIDTQPDVSYFSKYQADSIYDTPAVFIFLVDQSGSMSGKPISIVKEALLLFIQSLPPNSYFQIIGFGSNFQKYNEHPVQYTVDNINNIKSVIKSLSSNKGGTDISKPLTNITKTSKNDYVNIHLAKNIFLLTDGQVNNKEECVQIIADSSNTFRYHALGIGNDYDKDLIEKAGTVGKGSSYFVNDINNIKNEVINSLNHSMRPYLVNCAFDMQLQNHKLIYPEITQVIYLNDIVNFGKICKGKEQPQSPIKVVLTGERVGNEIKSITNDYNINNILSLPDGDELSKSIVGELLSYEELPEDKEIAYAKEYQILTKQTALFGECKGSGSGNDLVPIKLEYPSSYRGFMHHNVVMAPKLMMRPAPRVGCARPMAMACAQMAMAPMEPMEPKTMDFACAPKKLGINHKCLKGKAGNGGVANVQKVIPNNESSNKNNLLENVIESQDAIDGFWDKSKNIEELISQNKELFQRVKSNVDNVVKVNDQGLKDKILYTTFVIYFLMNKKKEEYVSLRLIIGKAKKYIERMGFKYEDIVEKI